MKSSFSSLFSRLACLASLWLLPLSSAHAQWQTQSILVRTGWTAIYLHVDASYQNLDQLVGSDFSNPISEIWVWQPPPSSVQFVTSPQTPITGGSQWGTWGRLGTGITSTMNTLIPNAAYLIHSVAATNYTWRLKGKPQPPLYTWSTSGLNFLGFPTVPTNPPAFDSFLALAPAFASTAEIYQYQGGNLGSLNPSRLFAYHTTPVTRGQAFWMRSGTLFNSYFGPFQIDVTGGQLAFGDSLSQFSFHLRNVTSSNVTVSVRLAASETPPAGQPSILAVPPLLVRGSLVLSNLTYGYSNLPVGAVQSWTLAPQGRPGSEVTAVLGLNRYAMTNAPGTLFAGILQFTDSFNFTELDVPVSAQVASKAGLWVGNANVSQVANYLKSYQRDVNNVPVVSSNGNYIVTGINTNLGAIPQPYALRLIVHNDGTNAALLQRVFYGVGLGSNTIVSTSETLLDPAHLANARRISAIHLPWSAANLPWPLAGQFLQGGSISATVDLPYDDQVSNPFLHTYHPDHDNLDATFKNQLPQGAESYRLTRQITLSIIPPANDFASLTSASQTLYGDYQESVTLSGLAGASRNFNVTGFFSLNRISDIATLSTP